MVTHKHFKSKRTKGESKVDLKSLTPEKMESVEKKIQKLEQLKKEVLPHLKEFIVKIGENDLKNRRAYIG